MLWPHLGRAELCFSQLNSLPSPQQAFLHYLPVFAVLPSSCSPALLLMEIVHPTVVPSSLLLLTCPASAGRAALRVLVVAPNHNPCWGHIYTSRGIRASLRSFGLLPCLGVRRTVARAGGAVQVQAG